MVRLDDMARYRFRHIDGYRHIPAYGKLYALVIESIHYKYEYQVEQLDEKRYPYRALLGSQLYLSTLKRPDIYFSVGILSLSVAKCTIIHWKAAKQILSFSGGMLELCIKVRQISLNVTADMIGGHELLRYIYSDWAGDVHTRKC